MKEVPISRKKVLKKNRGYLEVARMSNQGKEKIMEQSLWHPIDLVLNQFERLKDGIERKRKKFFRYALFFTQI